ncbi:MAG: nuclear transport factor 2 family protein [Pseudomonas sp.]
MGHLSEREVVARAEILETLVAYCQAQDQQHWDLYDAVFAPEATIALHGMPLPPMCADAFKAFLVDFNRTRISGQHLLGNVLYRIAGDTARTLSEVIYLTLHPTDEPGVVKRIRGNALYVDDLVRGEDGWRIRKRVIAQKNVETDQAHYDDALLAGIRAAAARDWSADLDGDLA